MHSIPHTFFTARRVAAAALFFMLLATAALTGARAQSAAAGDGWSDVCADCLPTYDWLVRGAAQLDGADRVHALIGGDALYYLTNRQGAWQRRVVDPRPNPFVYGLAVDAQNRVHILYHYANEAPTYAVRQDQLWQSETIPVTPGAISRHGRLAVDDQDRIHVALEAHPGILYGSRTAHGWQMETVTAAGKQPALAMTAGGTPHLAFLHLPHTVTYAVRNGAGWTVTPVVDVPHIDDLAIDLDSNDAPHFAIRTAPPEPDPEHEIYYLYRGDAGWIKEPVTSRYASILPRGFSLQLQISDYDLPYILYVTLRQGGPHLFPTLSVPSLAVRSSTGWSGDTFLESGKHPLLMLDSAGQPTMLVHRVYATGTDGPYHRLVHASANDIEIVDNGGDVGYFPNLAVDAAGWPVVLHRDLPDNEIRAGRWRAGAWESENVFRSAGLKSPDDVALAIGPHFRAHALFGYFTHSSGNVGYLMETPAGLWEASITGLNVVRDDAGSFDLTVDHAGRRHFLAAVNYPVGFPPFSGVRYTLFDTGEMEFVDRRQALQRFGNVSLVLDETERPHVSYVDVEQDTLRYGVREPAGWVTTTLTTGADDPDLALDPQGRPHIIFQNSAERTLVLLFWDGSRWIREIVDPRSGTGYAPAIDVDGRGRPHVAYLDRDDRLIYAVRDGGWQRQILGQDVAPHLDLVTDLADAPHIVYREPATGDLRHLYQAAPTAVTVTEVAGDGASRPWWAAALLALCGGAALLAGRRWARR